MVRTVFSLGVSNHSHKITSLWKFGLNWSLKLRENDDRKNTLVGRICLLSDKNKRLLARSLILFKGEITSFSKTTLLQRESCPSMFYTINSSPMLLTESVFKLIFVLSNNQTFTIPLKQEPSKYHILQSNKVKQSAEIYGKNIYMRTLIFV